jgi:hypothetical protein
MEKRPDAKIIPLGIGDTTEPLTETVSKAMADAALGMGTREGYSGCSPLLLSHTLYCENAWLICMAIVAGRGLPIMPFISSMCNATSAPTMTPANLLPTGKMAITESDRRCSCLFYSNSAL